MADSAQEKATQGDVDHGLGDVDAGLVVADKPAPSDHPTKGAFDDPASGQDLEAGFGGEAPHDLDNEVAKDRLVHELSAVVGAVGEEMLHPQPGTDVYIYGGWEHADRAGAASTAGYGSPTLVNTGCNTEGSTVCSAETKDIRQLTGGAWQDLIKGTYGRVDLGLQGSYTVRQAFRGVGGAPNTNEGVVITSSRYYPF